jgi:hypothetical protein
VTTTTDAGKGFATKMNDAGIVVSSFDSLAAAPTIMSVPPNGMPQIALR